MNEALLRLIIQEEFTALGIVLSGGNLTQVGGTAQTGRDITPDLKVLTDLKKGAENADGVAPETGDVLKAISRLYAYDPTGGHEHWDRLQAKDLSGDGLGSSQLGLITQGAARLFNGTSFDRARNNAEITALASAARSSTTTSADLTNHNARGLFLLFDVTAAPGGGETVTFNVQYKLGDGYATAFTDGTPRAVTGKFFYGMYPSALATTAYHGQNNAVIPRTWRVNIGHSAGGEWTYSVSACYIL